MYSLKKRSTVSKESVHFMSKPLFKHSSAPQEADSDRPKDLHPAQTHHHNGAAGHHSSGPAAQNHHHPAPADHCAPGGKTDSCQYPASAPLRSEPSLQHIFSLSVFFIPLKCRIDNLLNYSDDFFFIFN